MINYCQNGDIAHDLESDFKVIFQPLNILSRPVSWKQITYYIHIWYKCENHTWVIYSGQQDSIKSLIRSDVSRIPYTGVVISYLWSYTGWVKKPQFSLYFFLRRQKFIQLFDIHILTYVLILVHLSQYLWELQHFF